MKAIISISSAALLTLAAGHAAAQTDDTGPRKAAVSYADLDLSHATGRVVLERRVASAVDRVCPERPLPTELDKMGTYRTCRESAWTGARQQLAAIYNGKQFAESAVRVAGN
jgi:UrcA family protein